MIVSPLVFLAPVLLAPPAASPDEPMAAEHRIEVDGLDRGYLLYEPAGAPAGPLPLVLIFHGEGGRVRGTEQYFGMDRIADEFGFLVAYPEGLEQSWDDGRGIAPGGTRGTDDVKFVRALVDQVASRRPVDRTRVFAAGMSTGGMFCHRLAERAADLVAAVAPVAGPIARPYIDDFRLDRPVSLLVIQGDADPIIPIGGGFLYPSGLQRRGRISALDETVAKYLEAAGIEGMPVVTPIEDAADDGTTSERRVYPVGEGGTRVEVVLVKGGGHGLPGHVREYPEWAVGKTSQDFDGSRLIWEFFATCPPLPRDPAR